MAKAQQIAALTKVAVASLFGDWVGGLGAAAAEAIDLVAGPHGRV